MTTLPPRLPDQDRRKINIWREVSAILVIIGVGYAIYAYVSASIATSHLFEGAQLHYLTRARAASLQEKVPTQTSKYITITNVWGRGNTLEIAVLDTTPGIRDRAEVHALFKKDAKRLECSNKVHLSMLSYGLVIHYVIHAPGKSSIPDFVTAVTIDMEDCATEIAKLPVSSQ